MSPFDDFFILFMKMEMKFFFLMTQHVVVLLIMDMESAKSDVNGPKKKVRFWRILIKA